MVLNFVVLVIEMISEIYRSQKFVEFWNSLEDFDNALGIGGGSIGSKDLTSPSTLSFIRMRGKRIVRRAKIYHFLVLALSILMWTLINRIGMFAFAETFVQNFGYLLMYIVACFTTIKLSGLVYFLGQRFEFLNDMIVEDKNGNKFEMKNLEKIQVLMKDFIQRNSSFAFEIA